MKLESYTLETLARAPRAGDVPCVVETSGESAVMLDTKRHKARISVSNKAH